MDESSYLDPAALQAQCGGAIQVLESDKEAIYILENSLDSFINDGEIQGASFAAMKQQISDYKTVLQAIITAHESDKMDFEALKGAAVGEVLDGSKIIPNKKKAKENQEENERQAEVYRNLASSLPTECSWMSSIFNGYAYYYSRRADIEQRIYEKWKEKEETYDAIEAATSGLFSASGGMRTAIDSALSGINGAFRVAEGRYEIDWKAPWRGEIGTAKISLIEKQLNLLGIEPERVQELTDMGFTYDGLWEYRLMCQNKQEKEFYIQVLLGTEESYIKAFEINPNELNAGMTIFMADYSCRLLELKADGTATEESVRKIMEFNNAVLQSEAYCVDREGNFTEEKHRNVYLQKIAMGTEALLMKDVLILSGMSKSAEEYGISEKLYDQRCSMTLFWTTEAVIIEKLENMGDGVNRDYSISKLAFSDKSPNFDLNHYSSFAGEIVTDEVKAYFKEREELDTYFESLKLLALERAKKEAVPRAFLNLSKDMLLLLYGEASAPAAGFTKMALTALEGNVPSIEGMGGYLDENGKLGLNIGNTLYTGTLNGYLSYTSVNAALKGEEWRSYLEWFGKGGTYEVTYGDQSICLPNEGLSFAGCYNPDTLRAMEYWRENGMIGWVDESDSEIIRKFDIPVDGNGEVYRRILYGEGNVNGTITESNITMTQFMDVMEDIDNKVRDSKFKFNNWVMAIGEEKYE